MPYMLAPNKPFDLTTEHGRAQSYAYSSHGAFLVAVVEYCLQEQTDEVCDRVETYIEKELEQLNDVELKDQSLTQNLWLLHNELGVRDKKPLAALIRAYEDERSKLVGNITILTKLIEDVKIHVGIDEDEEDETKF